MSIKLSKKAENYLNRVKYGLSEGSQNCTTSKALNWCLEAMSDFEKASQHDLVGWMNDNYKLYTKE